MKIVCISDTHGMLNAVTVPGADVLIHAGDICGTGKLGELQRELLLLSKYPAKHILLTPGNHDGLFETDPNLARKMCADLGITVLINEEIAIDGVKFYLSPATPRFFDWHFMYDRGEEIAKVWAKIPDDTQVLVTHGQPWNINDPSRYGDPVGCKDLLSRIQDLKQLKLYVGGHLHSGYGTRGVNGVIYVNASVCTERYQPLNKPIEVSL